MAVKGLPLKNAPAPFCAREKTPPAHRPKARVPRVLSGHEDHPVRAAHVRSDLQANGVPSPALLAWPDLSAYIRRDRGGAGLRHGWGPEPIPLPISSKCHHCPPPAAAGEGNVSGQERTGQDEDEHGGRSALGASFAAFAHERAD